MVFKRAAVEDPEWILYLPLMPQVYYENVWKTLYAFTKLLESLWPSRMVYERDN
jgi:hypothetical protein